MPICILFWKKIFVNCVFLKIQAGLFSPPVFVYLFSYARTFASTNHLPFSNHKLVSFPLIKQE